MELNELKPFAMDNDKESLVVFRLNRGENLDAFIFVYPPLDGERYEVIDRRYFRIGTYRELELYSKWTGEPLDVSGNFPEEIIEAAMQFISDLPSDVKRHALDAFNEQVKMLDRDRESAKEKKNDPDASEYDKMTPEDLEREHMRMVEVAVKEYNGKIMFF